MHAQRIKYKENLNYAIGNENKPEDTSREAVLLGYDSVAEIAKITSATPVK
jgi:hypothetical protein